MSERIGIVNLGLIESVTIRTLLGDVVVAERRGSAVLRAELGTTGRYAFMMKTSGNEFDAVEVEFSGLALAAMDYDVHYAAIRQRSRPDVVLADASMGDAISTGMSGLCLGCTVDSAENAVDASPRDYATLGIPLGVVASVRATTTWRQTIPAGSRGGALLSTPSGILDVEVLARLRVRLLLDGTVVAEETASDMAAINYRNGRTFVQIRSDQPFDQVEVSIAGVVGLATEVRLHSVAAVVHGGLPSPDFMLAVDAGSASAEPEVPSTSAEKVAGLTFGDVFPNPVSDRARVFITLDAPAEIGVTIHDLLGREVDVIHDAYLDAGRHSLDIDTSRLASGVYMVVGQTAEGRVTRQLTVAR